MPPVQEEPLPAPTLHLLQEHMATMLALVRCDGDEVVSEFEWKGEAPPRPGVELWSRAVQGTTLRMFKARAAIPAPAATVAVALLLPEMRRRWDSSYASVDDLVHYTEGGGDGGGSAGGGSGGSTGGGSGGGGGGNSGGGGGGDGRAGIGCTLRRRVTVQRMSLHAIGPVSPREFVAYQLYEPPHDGEARYVCTGVSTTHPLAPTRKGVIRGEVMPGSGWVLEPSGSSGSGGGGGEGGTCVMTHVSFADIKGWLPHFIINGALSENYRKHFSDLINLVHSLPI